MDLFSDIAVSPDLLELFSLFQTQIRFDKYFRVEEIQKYHRAMLLEDFMADIAPTIWPVGKRIGDSAFLLSEKFSMQ